MISQNNICLCTFWTDLVLTRRELNIFLISTKLAGMVFHIMNLEGIYLN